MSSKERFTIKVPASTANLGPGFDCLGMALELWNTFTFERGGSEFKISGEGEGEIELAASNLVLQSFRRGFEEIGSAVPEVAILCRNEVPLHRGLGSSSTAVVGGLVAANEMSGRLLSDDRLLELATEIEGHPDNVAAALLGGCRIVVQDQERVVTTEVILPPDLVAVAFVPDFAMPTKDARGLLSPSVSRQDAVYNIGRVAMLVAALASGDLTRLPVATQDRLHQIPRQAVFPAMQNIFWAALDAGAAGVFLSGAGSTVLALATEQEMTIGYEMADAAAKSGVNGSVKVIRPSVRGAHLVD